MAQKQSVWPKIRKFFNDIHLWLGLSSGIIVVLVCFSGTLYTFNTEFTEMGASHLYKLSSAGTQAIETEKLIAQIESVNEGKVTGVTIPNDPRRSYQLTVRKEGDNSRFGTTYFVNQYTGDILGTSLEKNSAKEFMSTMFSLHRWLLIDKIEKPLSEKYTNREIGSIISGTATIIFTLGCITGLIIWFPNKLRTWRQGLKVKFSGNWKRTNYDLHNTLAFYSLFFLLLMGLTGPQWSFGWYRDGLQKVLGTYKPPTGQPGGKNEGPKPEKEAKPVAEEEPATVQYLDIASVVRQSNEALPYKGNLNITLPKNAKDPYQVSKTKVGFFAPAAADRVTLANTDGEIIKVERFKDKPFNERVAGSIKAIHVGNVYGTFTKIIYFLACLVATSLPVTGTLIWWNKLKKKRKAARKKIAQVIPNISLSS